MMNYGKIASQGESKMNKNARKKEENCVVIEKTCTTSRSSASAFN